MFACVNPNPNVLRDVHRAIVAWCAARRGMKRIKPVTSSPVASTGRPSAGTSTSLPCCRRSDALAPSTHTYTSPAPLILTILTIVTEFSQSVSLCQLSRGPTSSIHASNRVRDIRGRRRAPQTQVNHRHPFNAVVLLHI